MTKHEITDQIYDGCNKEYDPGISVEQWGELLQDKSVFTENSLRFIKRLIHFGGIASCSDLAKNYGAEPNFYNSNGTQIGMRIYKRGICELDKGVSEEYRYYKIPIIGKYKNGKENGEFLWILRPELWNALEELGGLEWEKLQNVPLYEIDENKFKNLISQYKDYIKNHNGLSEEIFKWEFIAENQGFIKFDDNDFVQKFKRMFVANPIFNNQTKYEFNNLLENHLVEYKTVLENLFEENIDLAIRVKNFAEQTDKIVEKSTQHDENFASVLLTLKYPQKYTFYKNQKVYLKLCSFLEIKPKSKPNCLVHYYELVDFLLPFIEQDSELLNIIRKKTSHIENCVYNNKLIIQDMFYQMENYYKQSSNWITPCNPEKYNHLDAFKNLDTVFWKQSTNVIKGDIVYIYVSGDDKRLHYKCECIESDCKHIEMNDIQYCSEELIESLENAETKVMRLKLLKSFDLVELDFNHLKQNGLNSIQGPQKLKSETINYINSILENTGDTKMTEQTYTKHNKEISLLKANKNLIFHGAPGTGKTFTAKEIAAQIIFGEIIKEDEMTSEQKKQWQEQFGFVQFHPSYDYTDFVEGLRPSDDNEQNVSGFKRMNGVFKDFCERAAKNFEDSKKSVEEINEIKSLKDFYFKMLEDIEEEKIKYFTQKSGKKIFIRRISKATGKKPLSSLFLQSDNFFEVSDKNEIQITYDLLERLSEIYKTKKELESINNIVNEVRSKGFGGNTSALWAVLHYLYEQIEKNINQVQKIETIKQKNYIFLIDEINRGESSKIFGELFFSIDPGYRGIAGKIDTQYQNLVPYGDIFDNGFYIPENVYIIGTMNDIDRSVETMDFAFRRRFAWKNVKACDTQDMLDSLVGENGITKEIVEKAKAKMNAINEKIAKNPDLGESYQIGGAYFMKLKDYNGKFEKLWEYHLEGLITEYLRGQGELESLVGDYKTLYDDAGEVSVKNEVSGENDVAEE